MKSILFSLVLGFSTNVAWADDSAYQTLPNAHGRAANPEYYKSVSALHLELVKENVGTPSSEFDDAVVAPQLKTSIDNGYFLSLQLRDLFVIPKESRTFPTTGNATVPFIISVKHSQRFRIPFTNESLAYALANQGTIEVAGEFTIQISERGLEAKVEKFYDSQWLEVMGRKLGANSDINIEFAKALVKPVLEAYYKRNPDQIKQLLPEGSSPLERMPTPNPELTPKAQPTAPAAVPAEPGLVPPSPKAPAAGPNVNPELAPSPHQPIPEKIAPVPTKTPRVVHPQANP